VCISPRVWSARIAPEYLTIWQFQPAAIVVDRHFQPAAEPTLVFR
jgi:hypothetical protein